MSASPPGPYLNVFTVKEFETKDGETARKWTQVGVAFPHADGTGFNVELQCVPLTGKLVALPPQEEERDSASASVGSSANGHAARSSTAKSSDERPAARETRNSSRERRR